MISVMKDLRLLPPVTGTLVFGHFTNLRDLRTDQELHKLGIYFQSSNSGVLS